jgi:hypothetical protein
MGLHLYFEARHDTFADELDIQFWSPVQKSGPNYTNCSIRNLFFFSREKFETTSVEKWEEKLKRDDLQNRLFQWWNVVLVQIINLCRYVHEVIIDRPEGEKIQWWFSKNVINYFSSSLCILHSYVLLYSKSHERLRFPVPGLLEPVHVPFEIIDGHVDLLLGVHDEGAQLRDRLTDGLAADEQEPERLVRLVPHLDAVAGAEEKQVVRPRLVGPEHALALQHVHERVPRAAHGLPHHGARPHREVQVHGRRPRAHRRPHAHRVAGDHAHRHAVRRRARDVLALDLLVPGLDPECRFPVRCQSRTCTC